MTVINRCGGGEIFHKTSENLNLFSPLVSSERGWVWLLDSTLFRLPFFKELAGFIRNFTFRQHFFDYFLAD